MMGQQSNKTACFGEDVKKERKEMRKEEEEKGKEEKKRKKRTHLSWTMLVAVQ